MNEPQNGEPIAKPGLMLTWDEATQDVQMVFDSALVKNWVYARMLLMGAVAKVDQYLSSAALQGALQGMASQAQQHMNLNAAVAKQQAQIDRMNRRGGGLG